MWEFFSNSHLETLPFYSWEHERSFSLQKSCCDTNLHRTENMLMLPSVLSNLEHLQLGVKQSIWIQMQHFPESYEKLFSNLTEKNQTKWSCRMLVEIIIVIAQSKSLKDCNRGWNIFCDVVEGFFFPVLLYNSAIGIELEIKSCRMVRRKKKLLWDSYLLPDQSGIFSLTE